MLNQPQMFPNEWKMIIDAPLAGQKPPHQPATPTCHTHFHSHRHTYLLHPPGTSISPMTYVFVGWVCQVGVSSRRVMQVC